MSSLDIRQLAGRNKGETAFILGNGPSITECDLQSLQGRLTIGMNASTDLEHRYGFVQTYYTLSDRRFLEHSEKGHWATNSLNPSTIRVLRADLRHSDDSSLGENTVYTPHLKRDGFSRDLSIGYYYGCTTTMLALQLAAYLGCEKICLLGVDLRYRPDSARFYTEAQPQVEDSFTSVQIWNLANGARTLKERGVEVINCSPNSLLRPHLPFESFDSLANTVENSLANASLQREAEIPF